jgi:hypothetical protein
MAETARFRGLGFVHQLLFGHGHKFGHLLADIRLTGQIAKVT